MSVAAGRWPGKSNARDPTGSTSPPTRPSRWVLVKRLRALGGRETILAGDTLTIPDLVQSAGPAAEGVLIGVGVPTVSRLPAAGRRFVASFGRTIHGPVDPTALSYAQAADVLLDAIAASDGTRASVTAKVFATHLRNGLLGDVSFDSNGDSAAGVVTVWRIVGGRGVIYARITPPPTALARG